MSRKLTVLMLLSAFVVAALAGCGGSSSTSSTSPSPVPPASSDPKSKYIGGKWLTRNIENAAEGYDVVFKADNTYDGYFPGDTNRVITGPYQVDAAGNMTGDFTALWGGRVGRVEGHLEQNNTILYFKFIETNAYDNPTNVNGVVVMECRGPNPTKP